MRVPSNRSRGSLGFNMTPMIDVVFLLIIFFLVSSHLARQEAQLELDLPSASTGQTPDQSGPRRVVVNVLPEASGGRRILVGGALLSADELDQLIRHESGQADGRIEVRIRGDQNVPYRDVEPILLACARAGVWNVTFAVVEESTGGIPP
ncbi:MAG: biopolymer transporter ExbD [Pirellulales bacterium]|nr:biopolymer transporter ExbD [Pirellulales bacterium]